MPNSSARYRVANWGSRDEVVVEEEKLVEDQDLMLGCRLGLREELRPLFPVNVASVRVVGCFSSASVMWSGKGRVAMVVGADC